MADPTPRRRGRAPSVLESPLLVGAVIMAMGIVGVILSANANKGLPFAPTYQITADVPDAAELIEAGSEVRTGGARVGIVKEIEAMPPRGDKPAFARLTLSLNPSLTGLPADTEIEVRPRSVLAAKYLDLTPGRSGRRIPQGGHLPLSQARAIVELDETFNVFDKETSNGLRSLTTALGDALAGRGSEINRTAVSTRRLIAPLQRVLVILVDPDTDLEGLIVGAAQVTTALAEVAPTLGELIENGAVTLEALDLVRGPFGEAVDELPETELVTTRALRKINPVLADAAAISRDIKPGTHLLPPSTRDLADALEEATPVLARTPGLAERLDNSLQALEHLSNDPSTNETLRALFPAVENLRSTLRVVVPAQLQCNVFGLYGRNLIGTISEGDAVGTWLTSMAVLNITEGMHVAEPDPDLHLNMQPHENHQECEAGNEPFKPGQRIGNPGGKQSNETEDT